MAYRKRRATSRRRAPARRATSRRVVSRRPRTRSAVRRKSSGRNGQTIRIVIEQPGSNQITRPQLVEGLKSGAFKRKPQF